VSNTKIEWCDQTWNPVIGCRRGCPYCYADKLNRRFKFIKYWNMPQWKETNFDRSFPKKPTRIFVNSMSDIEYWEDVWMQRVLEKIKEYPQHTFLFLTKKYNIYNNYVFPRNCWLGSTVVNQDQMNALEYTTSGPYKNKTFVSIEPIQGKIQIIMDLEWIIIGAETGNRKDKIIPEKHWIKQIVKDAKFEFWKTPVFMKNNLKQIWPDKLIQEFPE
jgi:protein gp37